MNHYIKLFKISSTSGTNLVYPVEKLSLLCHFHSNIDFPWTECSVVVLPFLSLSQWISIIGRSSLVAHYRRMVVRSFSVKTKHWSATAFFSVIQQTVFVCAGLIDAGVYLLKCTRHLTSVTYVFVTVGTDQFEINHKQFQVTKNRYVRHACAWAVLKCSVVFSLWLTSVSHWMVCQYEC